MRIFSFKWQENDSLALQLAAGVRRLSVNTDIRDTPIAVTLWQGESTKLRIRSQMNDIAERLEVGVLEFTRIQSWGANDPSIDFSKCFEKNLKIEKLVIAEQDVMAESGIVLENPYGEQIIIVAGASPYTLAVRAPSYEKVFQPEYPLDHYRRVVMTKA
ncbi:MAG: hypothetical protein ACREFK_14845 [Stellaceae bacterium]